MCISIMRFDLWLDATIQYFTAYYLINIITLCLSRGAAIECWQEIPYNKTGEEGDFSALIN